MMINIAAFGRKDHKSVRGTVMEASFTLFGCFHVRSIGRNTVARELKRLTHMYGTVVANQRTHDRRHSYQSGQAGSRPTAVVGEDK